MNKEILSIVILISSVIVSGSIVAAQTAGDQSVPAPVFNIVYPISELGSCSDKESCKSYCDIAENVAACVAFGEKNKILSGDNLERAKKFVQAGSKGPGGCSGQAACDEYCQNIDHIDECIAFAESKGLMLPEEIDQAKKVQAAIKKGVKPPACKNKKECDVYCEDSNHMEECINFGVEAGFIQGKELEDAQKVLTAIKKGVKPPPCKGKDACDEYCQNPDNIETCMNFAIEAGMIDERQKEESQKFLQAIKKGVKPPACSGKEECDIYCRSEEHIDECVNFSVAAGIINEKDAEIAKKTKGRGPGGCASKDECDAFCDDPNNSEICFNFAKESGLISAEELQKVESSQQQIKGSFNNMPSEVLNCLTTSLGVDTIEKLKSGNAMPGQKMAEQMRACFEQFTPTAPFGPEGQTGGIQGMGGQERGGQPGQFSQPVQPGQLMQPGQTIPTQPTKPEKPSGTVNPTQCISDCEAVGRDCISQIENGLKKSCDSSFDNCNSNCNTNVCQNFEPGGGLPGVPRDDAKCKACFSQCYNESRPCYNNVVTKESACTTTKDECVTQCQKAAKGGKPIQPTQPGQQPTMPGQQPSQPTQPTKPTQPMPPTKPSFPTQPSMPTQPGQLTPPTQPFQFIQPMPPTQPIQPIPPQPPMPTTQ